MCPANSTHAANDDASSGNTACDCIAGTAGDGFTSCGEHVWTTDNSALLGVRDGAPVDLLNRIGPSNAVWTGMRADHTTLAPTDACEGRRTEDSGVNGQIGNSGVLDGRFLEIGSNPCDLRRSVDCAEQP